MKRYAPATVKTKKDQFKHARKRISERYGEFISEHEYNQMISDIQNSKCLLLQKESHTRTHFLVNDKFIVVYDKARKSICTFLPPEAINNYLPLKKEDNEI